MVTGYSRIPYLKGVFEHPEASKCISRYIHILKGKLPSRNLLCKTIKVDYSKDEPLSRLWLKHEQAMEIHRKLERAGDIKIKSKSPSLIDLKREISYRILKACVYCERRCEVDRLKGEKGYCRLGIETRVASAFSHYGEEKILIPSGTIFFSSCNFSCVFCQNWDISTRPTAGIEVDGEKLARIMVNLVSDGCININLVGGDPTPNLHTILDALSKLDVNVPIIWNSNLYNSMEAMKLLEGVIDVWLPDFKYYRDECALKLSKVRKYREVITRNLRYAYRRGEIILRHLVLPSHLDCCTKPILKWISENTPNILVNIMGQYRPEYKAYMYPEINRRPSYDEMHEAFKYAELLNLNYRLASY